MFFVSSFVHLSLMRNHSLASVLFNWENISSLSLGFCCLCLIATDRYLSYFILDSGVLYRKKGFL